MLRGGVFFLPLVFALAAQAQAPAIQHDPVDCIVAGKFAVIPACFEPADQMARARVYFQAEESTSWYYVDVKAQGAACWSGILPKPKSELLDHHVRYYVEVVTRGMDATRTADH